MNEELTNEVLEAMTKCDQNSCSECLAVVVCCSEDDITIEQRLATALLEERAKPKDDVWKYAPDWATQARVEWDCPGPLSTYKRAYSNYYTRELPKTRADEIADEVWHEINKGVTGYPTDIIKRAITKYAEELQIKK